jgi:hypothetical protein
MANENLRRANRTKNDEFYTQLRDIENECRHYKEHFHGKTILCNCDDPRVSSFFEYFYTGFHALGLKQIIATCYKNLNPDLFSQDLDKQAVYCIYDGEGRTDDRFTNFDTFIKQNEWGILKGDGDFRSPECIELLKQADIVCTNPPFSLFREYVAQLIEYDKKFLIIGNQNAITYKEIFKLLKENKIWLGYGFKGNVGFFSSPTYKDYAKASEHREGLIRISGVQWFTNLDSEKRHDNLTLWKKYTPNEFPEYDNYNAINVDKTNEIPVDYDGVMGVPITFLDKYNPDQFEIIDGLNRYTLLDVAGINEWAVKNHKHLTEINGKSTYFRVLIKRKA